MLLSLPHRCVLASSHFHSLPCTPMHLTLMRVVH